MKPILLPFFSVLFIISCTNTQEKIPLFNGENLDGWRIFVEDSTVNPKNYFYVNNGVIETVGSPLGYLRTVDEFENYELHVEWRYTKNPTNSGIFLHTTGPDKIWPDHFQAQLKHQNAGDFIVNGVGNSAVVNDTLYTSTIENKPLIPMRNPTNERHPRAWNSYDITCKGNTIEIRVNGLLQNIATDCSVSKGSIGLQGEGSEIQFRNLWIKKLN